MNAKDLITALQAMPQEAEVTHLWDGCARTVINHVWLSRGGKVVTADSHMVCYDGEDRPETAPTQAQSRYWTTP